MKWMVLKMEQNKQEQTVEQNEQEQTAEQVLLAWCVKYVHDLCTDDQGTIDTVMDMCDMDEGTLFDTFETLSQTHKFNLEDE